MPFSAYLKPRILDLLLSNTTFPAITAVFAELHTGDPGLTGTGSPLASCKRAAIVFNTAVSATAVNATTVDFAASASGTISYLSLWDGSATATANCLLYGPLATTKNVNTGDTVRLTSAALSAITS